MVRTNSGGYCDPLWRYTKTKAPAANLMWYICSHKTNNLVTLLITYSTDTRKRPGQPKKTPATTTLPTANDQCSELSNKTTPYQPNVETSNFNAGHTASMMTNCDACSLYILRPCLCSACFFVPKRYSVHYRIYTTYAVDRSSSASISSSMDATARTDLRRPFGRLARPLTDALYIFCHVFIFCLVFIFYHVFISCLR
jgi:hypothetical protein